MANPQSPQVRRQPYENSRKKPTFHCEKHGFKELNDVRPSWIPGVIYNQELLQYPKHPAPESLIEIVLVDKKYSNEQLGIVGCNEWKKESQEIKFVE